MKRFPLFFIFALIIMPLLFCSAKGDSLMDSGMSRYGDDRELAWFLTGFSGTVEKGDWIGLLEYFDRDNYLGQALIGVGDYQYIIEGMALPMDIFIDSNAFININHLKGIGVINILYTAEDYYAVVSGTAILSDGNKVPFSIRIKRNIKGRLVISPPVG